MLARTMRNVVGSETSRVEDDGEVQAAKAPAKRTTSRLGDFMMILGSQKIESSRVVINRGKYVLMCEVG